MGKIHKQLHEELIDPVPDRWAEMFEIKNCDHGDQYLIHINYRNIQIKLTPDELKEWKIGLSKALPTIQERMKYDI